MYAVNEKTWLWRCVIIVKRNVCLIFYPIYISQKLFVHGIVTDYFKSRHHCRHPRTQTIRYSPLLHYYHVISANNLCVQQSLGWTRVRYVVLKLNCITCWPTVNGEQRTYAYCTTYFQDGMCEKTCGCMIHSSLREYGQTVTWADNEKISSAYV